MGWPKTPWTEAQRAWAVSRINELRAGLRAASPKERRRCADCGRDVLVVNGRLRSHGFDSLRPFTSRCKASGRKVRVTVTQEPTAVEAKPKPRKPKAASGFKKGPR